MAEMVVLQGKGHWQVEWLTHCYQGYDFLALPIFAIFNQSNKKTATHNWRCY